MRTYILKRFVHMIPLLLGITFFSFLIISLAPGDYLTAMSQNPQISTATIEGLRAKFGLDRPWYIQYAKWLWNAIHLDFGYSFANQVPVFFLIRERMLNTLILALSAALFAWGLSIPLGIISAVRQNTWVDRSSSFVSFIGLSIPEVFFALLMVLFAAKSGWFPVGGMKSIDFEYLSYPRQIIDLLYHLVLPTIVLGSISMAGRMRQMRANLLDTLLQDYIQTARAKGLSERIVIYKHALRNAINPLITLFGFTLANMLSGAFLVEVIMSWPGLGRLTLDALFSRDLYLVMGSLLMASVMLILGNLAADILLALSDPRIRYE
ncbi:ABC transporter permease [bacterium]|nr:ABC transporter permease [bacterium]